MSQELSWGQAGEPVRTGGSDKTGRNSLGGTGVVRERMEGGRAARWSLRPFSDPSRLTEHHGNGSRGRSTELQMFLRVWVQQALPAQTCRRHRVTWRVIPHGLCAEMGWDGATVGPKRMPTHGLCKHACSFRSTRTNAPLC